MLTPSEVQDTPSPDLLSTMEPRAAALFTRRTHATSDDVRGRLNGEIAETYLPFAHSLAARYSGRGIEDDDLRQVAAVGLIKAVARFDPRMGKAFPVYALPTVNGELKRHFRDLGWAVRPIRRVQELNSSLRHAQERAAHHLGSWPTRLQLAAELGVTEADVAEAILASGCYAAWSTDAPSTESGATLADRLGGLDPDISLAELRTVLFAGIIHLSPSDRRIVMLRFYDGMTQNEIAAETGSTQMQVSRALRRILRQLKAELDPRVA